MNLAKLAAFLGPTYAVHDDPDDEGTPYIIWEVAPSYWHGRFKSDAELFYALLVRAAEKGLETGLSYMPHMKCWAVDLGQWSRGKPLHKGPTPLAALAAAVEALK